jgi:periplasmic divalent cation tolerance protein
MTMQNPSPRLILTTFADESEAEPIVRQLLLERLIACGTLLPGARSLYHWKGVVEEASEVVVLFKTDEVHSSTCMARLAELHPYETPEILEVVPESFSLPYAAWIKEALSKSD